MQTRHKIDIAYSPVEDRGIFKVTPVLDMKPAFLVVSWAEALNQLCVSIQNLR
jgi:hypothetical protein